MGVLYMRVNGQWEAVTPYVPDEVQIMPSAPTTGGADLWVDSDDPQGPSINALIDGTWTKLTQPVPDEVFVGPSAPTDTATELWYDTDAPGYTAEDLRWQSAWGVVNSVTTTSPTTTAITTTATTIYEFSAGTLPAGRNMRVTVTLGAGPTVTTADSEIFVAIADTSNNHLRVGRFSNPTANLKALPYMQVAYMTTSTGAAMTFRIRMWVQSGTGTLAYSTTTEPITAVVEDVGPAVPLVPTVSPVGAYGKLNSVQGGVVGSSKVLLWNAPTGAGFTGRNMTATVNGLVVQVAGRYQINFAASLSQCSGGAYMVPQVRIWRAGSYQGDNASVVFGPSGYWLSPSVTCQINCLAGDEVRAQLDTDMSGCAFDSRTYLDATLIGPL